MKVVFLHQSSQLLYNIRQPSLIKAPLLAGIPVGLLCSRRAVPTPCRLSSTVQNIHSTELPDDVADCFENYRLHLRVWPVLHIYLK